MPAQMMTTRDVAMRLVELCQKGHNIEAIKELYSDKIVSEEVCGTPEMPAKMTGKEAVLGKNQWWIDNHKVHEGRAAGPFPHGDRFCVVFDYDVTAKAGPMKGKRMKMQEVGLYTVKDGKIVKEEFFYDMPE